MMDNLISDFSNHLRKAIEIGNSTEFSPSKNQINSILICGLGGSGIGGTIISQLFKNEVDVPVVINKDYFIPSFVNKNTLVVCCSYSGNTEETLSMYNKAKDREAEICIVTSGGIFKEFAAKNNNNIIEIPGSLPPRAAFGLSFPQLLFVFKKYGLTKQGIVNELETSIKLIENESENIKSAAKEYAKKLFNKTPIIYSEPQLEGVSIRFRQQINENSKMLCWHHVIPEMNHNELVGWRIENQDLAVVLFRSQKEFYRNTERINYLKGIVKNYTNTILEIYSKGNSLIQECLYLIHFGDWVSFYLSELRNVDAVEVDVITGLKNLLSDLD